MTSSVPSGTFDGSVVVVTGAASGIGLAAAAAFAAAGATLVLGDVHGDRLLAAVDQLSSTGADVHGVVGDVSVASDASALVDAAVSEFGQINVLCNVAGVMDLLEGVGDVSDAMWRRVMGVNLDGPMFTSRRAIAAMVEARSGVIINVASEAGVRPSAAGVAYSVAKSGLVALTKNTAWMYGPAGVRCNAVCPGATEATNIGESMAVGSVSSLGLERTALVTGLCPSTQTPSDIADAIVFLASAGASQINGAVLTVDGGWSAA